MVYNLAHKVISLTLNIIVKDVTQMKNAIKKLTAAVMAFTLLGVGTTITKTVAPESNNALIAHAGVPPQYCNHSCGTKEVLIRTYKYSNVWFREYAVCCKNCNTQFSVIYKC